MLDESYPPLVRRAVLPLTLARFSTNAVYRFAAPFLATIARGLDVDLADLGVALAVTELAGLTSPLVGRWIDRLRRFHPDVAALRRYLVDDGFMERAEGVYWRVGGTVEV